MRADYGKIGRGSALIAYVLLSVLAIWPNSIYNIICNTEGARKCALEWTLAMSDWAGAIATLLTLFFLVIQNKQHLETIQRPRRLLCARMLDHCREIEQYMSRMIRIFEQAHETNQLGPEMRAVALAISKDLASELQKPIVDEFQRHIVPISAHQTAVRAGRAIENELEHYVADIPRGLGQGDPLNIVLGVAHSALKEIERYRWYTELMAGRHASSEALPKWRD